MTNVVKFPLAGLDDKLVNTRALLNFALFTIEAADEQDFKAMKSDFCTMFYLLKDQLRGMELDAEALLRRDSAGILKERSK